MFLCLVLLVGNFSLICKKKKKSHLMLLMSSRECGRDILKLPVQIILECGDLRNGQIFSCQLVGRINMIYSLREILNLACMI